MVQVHQTALCNAAHPVQARIARCLLEVQDRCGSSDVLLTQYTLGQMLDVQRTTINVAAGELEEAGVISCRRGHIQIVRRQELQRHACECYISVKSYVSRLSSSPDADVLIATCKS
jgi:DNA-binding GntR family transcriptional regulator